MHIGVCHLLCDAGYFTYKGRDDEGWPHYEAQQAMPLDIDDLTARKNCSNDTHCAIWKFLGPVRPKPYLFTTSLFA